jgi:hypothetical protein
MNINILINHYYIQVRQEAQKNSNINLINYKHQLSTGYIHKIIDYNGIILVQLLITKPDGDNTTKRARICHYIGPLKHKE